MKLLNLLERKLGRNFGIRGLMTYIIGFNALVFFLVLMDKSGRFFSYLTLIPAQVLKGEVWRLVTYAFIPPTFSPLWFIFTLYFYYMIGTTLEHEWGTFKFNAYYLIGMLGTTAAVFITGGVGTSLYLNLSLFLAFAYIYPNYQMLIFFVLPVKIKYLAWLDAAFLAYTILVADLPGKAAAIVAVLNFILFFGGDILRTLKSGRKRYYNYQNFQSKIPRNYTIHKCEVCGRTEADSKDLEFRYCTECEGDHEYCMEHLYNHQHHKA